MGNSGLKLGAWPGGTGIYDYHAEAEKLLTARNGVPAPVVSN